MPPKTPAGFDDAETIVVPRKQRSSDASPSFRVRVTAGPDQGRAFDLSAFPSSRVLVGQSVVCELRLEDRQVSRRHLALEPEGAALRVSDLGSTNGTRVNGVRVIEALVTGGERIDIGATSLVLEPVMAPQPALSSMDRFGRLLGASAEMRRLYPLFERLAAANVPVVIEGETGTGKEVLAESLHEAGPRASAPFVVFDCTAVAPNLLEAALFGHERGAFTGAVDARRGVFEEAHGGTLLIDEIGDLDISLQAKLLRALERSEVQRIGANRWTRVNVRVIAATRRNLDQEVQAGRFRDDLFFRLAVARVELPPLRRRHGDVELLARTFWHTLTGGESHIPQDFVARLSSYAWPGNVRELYNAVARRVALGELGDGYASVGVASPSAAASSRTDAIERVLALRLPFPAARDQLLAQFEARYVERVLDEHGGNIAQAAAASGIARRYFQLIRARTRSRGPDG